MATKITPTRKFAFAFAVLMQLSATAAHAELPDTSKMRLTFDEEFNGATLDRTKWNDFYNFTGLPATGEIGYTVPQNVVPSPGTGSMIIQATYQQKPVIALGKVNGALAPIEHHVLTGSLTTQTKFSQAFGYFEMRAKFPRGNSFWPAFWLLPNETFGTSGPENEIDIVENWGDRGNMFKSTFHYYGNAMRNVWDAAQKKFVMKMTSGKQAVSLPIDVSAFKKDIYEGFHTYAVSWRPDAMTFFFDGIEVGKITEAVPSDPHYILANMAVQNIGVASDMPKAMEIDYIRAYQFNDVPAGIPAQVTFGPTTVTPAVAKRGDTVTINTSLRVGNKDLNNAKLQILVSDHVVDNRFSEKGIIYSGMDDAIKGDMLRIGKAAPDDVIPMKANTEVPVTFKLKVPANMTEGHYRVYLTLTGHDATHPIQGMKAAFDVDEGNLSPLKPTLAVVPTPTEDLPSIGKLNLRLNFKSMLAGGIANPWDDGNCMTLLSNAGGRAAMGYTITKKTMMEFTLQVKGKPKLLALSFGSSPIETIDPAKTIQLDGTDNVGVQSVANKTSNDFYSKTFKINIGELIGPMRANSILFIRSIDKDDQGMAVIRNPVLYEKP